MNDNLREKLRHLPEKPGCYIMRDHNGRIIYVGKAVSLRRRVQSTSVSPPSTRPRPSYAGLSTALRIWTSWLCATRPRLC